MRIAVLSMLEPLAVDGLLTRAGLRVGGEAVIEQQLELAIAAGAQRLLLLGDRRAIGLDDVVALASDAKLDVRVVADAPGLCSEVTAADEVLVFGDALLADPVLALPLLKAHGVATVPVEPGLQAGFERIDAENAWGGLMVIPGALAERLRQLPRDCDVASSLLRIALMAGVTVRPVEEQALADKRWVVVRNEAEGQAIEAHRLRLSLTEARGKTPGSRLAGLFVGKFGGHLFATDRSTILVWWAAVIPAAAAVVLASFGLFALALLAVALVWLTVRAAIILENAERQGRIAAALPNRKSPFVHLAIDLLLLFGIAFALADRGGVGSPGSMGPWFVAFVCIAILRIAARLFPVRQAIPWFEDRFSQCIVLAIAVELGMLAPLLMGPIMLVLAVWAAFVTLAPHRETS